MPPQKYAHTLPNRAVGWSGYKVGCRCPGCTAGNTAEMRRKRANRAQKAGSTAPGVPSRLRALPEARTGQREAATIPQGVQATVTALTESADAYRDRQWQNLMLLARHARETPGVMMPWKSDDGGRDIEQLRELLADWYEVNPGEAEAYAHSLSDDAMTFYLWIPEAIPQEPGIEDQLTRERHKREQFARQQAAAQRHQTLMTE